MPERPTPSSHAKQDQANAGAEPGLDDRKASILKAVVSEYIDKATPVGSSHVTGLPGVEVSSATVRAEMAALEREGFLVQPHTSAGRIPTDKGYRFFVDHLAGRGSLAAGQRREIRQFFADIHCEVEDLLGRTSGLLADLTHYASVVVATGHEAAPLRSVAVVSLAPKVALLVAVLADGTVEKRTLELPGEANEGVLGSAAAHMTAHLQGSLLRAPAHVPPSGDEAVDTVVAVALGGISSLAGGEEADHVFVGGSSRMAAAFDAVDTVRSVLSILEQQLVVVGLIEDILERGLSVAIGVEHGFEPLASCALVVAPVSVEGETAGTIGVLGPTRMNYPQALAAVHIVSEQLGRRLGPTGEGSASPSEPVSRGSRRTRQPAKRGE